MKKFLYGFGGFTGGLPITLIGLVVTLFLILLGYNVYSFCGGLYVPIGMNGGGFEMGPFFLIDTNMSLSTMKHERGHGNQLIFGPLFPLFVTIPSATRYGLFDFNTQKKRRTYCLIYSLINILVFGIPFILSFIFSGSLGIKIIFGFIFIYFICIDVGLIFYQLPKFKNKYPKYDDFGIENGATVSGNKTYNKGNKEN